MIRVILVAVVMVPLQAQTSVTSRIDVQATDANGVPLAGVRVEVSSGSHKAKPGETDEDGRVSFPRMPAGTYTISVSKNGFETASRENLELKPPAGLDVTFELIPALTRTDSVEVRGTVMEVEEDAATPNRLPPGQARELPSRPATVADALPLTPGVLREPGGGLILSSSPEHRSALIVNSADVTDPATGQFGLTVPIDSVEVLNVYQTAYMAEYGRFTAGLVSVETRRGGDKWKWELNDPLPEFRIRSWHLRGLKTSTPRLNFEGPLVEGKLFLSEGFEYVVRKTEIYSQEFPYNQKEEQGTNSFTQLDWVVSPRHLLTVTAHLAPQRTRGLTLDLYNPLATTPDAIATNYTGTVIDHLALWGGLLESRFSVTRFDSSVWGRGSSDMVISPLTNSGSFFAEQGRTASRISGASAYSFRHLEALGTHEFKVGGYIASSAISGNIAERPVDVVDASGQLLWRMVFPRTHDFQIEDTEKSFFGQDHWIITPRLAVDLGLRTESQQISGAFRVAPRGGLGWMPVARTHTMIRGGFGYFYDRVPLNVYGFNRYPSRVVTYYDADGNVSAGPFLYVNTLGQSRVRFPFVSQKPIDGNFSPRSSIWSMQVEQPLGRRLKLRATYLRNNGDALVIVNQVAPDPVTNVGAFLLEGTGSSAYRQFDIMAQLRLRDDRQLFFSYVRSRARGDLNDFGRFLGTVPTPIIHENQYGTLGTDLPNRFLTWGVVRLPHSFQVAPVVEFRSGFPYIETDAFQRYVGVPNHSRYPDFGSIDSRFSKDVKLNAKYSARLSISGFNLSNHFNPEAVRANSADPAYGFFLAQRGRRFTADFDFLF